MTDDEHKLSADEIRELIRSRCQTIISSLKDDSHGAYDPTEDIMRLQKLARKLKDAD